MQYYQDSVTGNVFAFEDDVVVTDTAGVYSFTTALRVALTVLPTTLQPCAGNVPPVSTVPVLTLAQQAAAIMAPTGAGAGIVLTCTSVSALSGTYAIDPLSQAKMTSIAAAIGAGLGLPGGGSTFNYPDISGALHPWTAGEFPAFAKAALDLVYALDMVVLGQTETLPSTAWTIA